MGFQFAVCHKETWVYTLSPHLRLRSFDDEDGFNHCVAVRAVKGGGVFLLDGDTSRAQINASGALIRVAVPFASLLDHGYKEQVAFLRELKLSQVRSKSFEPNARKHAVQSRISNTVGD